MPLYVFECPEHGERELFLPVEKRNEPQTCDVVVRHADTTGGMFPTPGYCGLAMTRKPTAAAAHFRGRGFYQTDYKDKGR